MAEWKKVVVSGSSAELAGLTVDATITGAITGDAGGNAATATKIASITNSNIVQLVDAQTLTNKDLTAGTNTFPTFNQDTTGNAATATALAASVNIGGVAFDGQSSINLPGVNTAGSQNTSGTAAGLSTTLAITSGGTGATSQQAAIDALTAASSATLGQVLSIDGSGNAVFSDANAGDITGIDAGTAITVTDPDTATPTVSVTAAGITETQLNASVAGAGLAGGAGTALSVSVDDSSIEISGDSLQVKALGITNAMLNGSIANGKLASSTISGISLGSNLNNLSVDNSTIEYSVGSTYNGSANSTIGIKDLGVTNAKLENDGITIAGSDTSLGGTISADTIVGAASADSIAQTQVSGLDTSLALKANLAGPTFTGTVSMDALSATGNVTLGNALTDTVTVEGDLRVKGTASFESSENLLVKDQFIGLGSGSNAGQDGGIVIEDSTANGGQGHAFAYKDPSGAESNLNNRWVVAKDVPFNSTSISADAFMAAVLAPTAANTVSAIDAIDSDYNKTGNIYTSNANDIWIYA